jgi:hypothetical protein
VIGSPSNVRFSSSLCCSTESQVTCLVVFRQLYGLDIASFNILLEGRNRMIRRMTPSTCRPDHNLWRFVQGGDHGSLFGPSQTSSDTVRLAYQQYYEVCPDVIALPPRHITSAAGLVFLRPPRFSEVHCSCRLSFCLFVSVPLQHCRADMCLCV